MTCQEHKKTFEMVCEDCQCMICSKCVTSTVHKGHEYSDFNEAEQKTRRKLEKILRKYKKELSDLENDMTLIKESQKAEKEMRSVIYDRQNTLTAELTQSVEGIAKKLNDFSEKNKQKRLDFLNDSETSTNVQITTKNKNIHRLELILKSTKQDVVIRAGMNPIYKDKDKEQNTPRLPIVQPLMFTAGETDDTDVERMFGQVNNTAPANKPVQGNTVPVDSLQCSLSPVDENSSDFMATPLQNLSQASNYTEWSGKSFQPSRNPIYAICPDTSGQAWIKCDRELRLSDENGNITKSNVFTNEITGMAMDKSRTKIIVANRHNQNIEQLSLVNFEKKKVFRCALTPLHICLAADGNFLIPMVDSKDTNPELESRRILLKVHIDEVDESGTKEEIAEYDQKGDRLFVIPERVRANASGTMVAVANRTNDSNSPAKQGAALAMGGHLVVLDGNLQLKYRYLGNDIVVPSTKKYLSSTSDTKFVVNDVDFDKNDNIILVDGYTKSVQLRRADDCTLIRLLLSDIAIPVCVAYRAEDPDGEIDEAFWVGFKTGKITIIKVIK